MKPICNDATEDIPTNTTDLSRKPIQLNVYCDSDHAAHCVTRGSHTGILIFVNIYHQYHGSQTTKYSKDINI